MNLLPHDFPVNASTDHLRSSGVVPLDASNEGASTLIAFRNSQQLSLLVRATAFVFSDPQSLQLQDLIKRIAPSEATALIVGETGTGKELVARHIHALSHRSDTAFVAVNCGAFSETLIESELFGYERGAFTGAMQSKAGWFETASGGTLFLDEIGDLPLPMQVKLLRVLQEREVVRLGGRRPVRIDVRLIAATNVDLAEAVRAGRFREDLYYRLQVVTLPLRPLRERAGDILPLAHHFLKMYVKRLGLEQFTLAPQTQRALLDYPWPGNIRELENVIHRALLVSRQHQILVSDLCLPAWVEQSPPAKPAGAANATISSAPAYAALLRAWRSLLESGDVVSFDQLQHQLIGEAWQSNQGNQVRTAKQLAISRNILRTYLKKAALL
ncbi:MAG: sigma-54-dependent Fis family transcriptional regulator [Herbaspirillum sp.]|nr:sigma-54-dependent Fis family transcriptional regulator [Herbaspirillum sp.]